LEALSVIKLSLITRQLSWLGGMLHITSFHFAKLNLVGWDKFLRTPRVALLGEFIVSEEIRKQ
jgi:hypothetical protein